MVILTVTVTVIVTEVNGLSNDKVNGNGKDNDNGQSNGNGTVIVMGTVFVTGRLTFIVKA